MNIAVTGASGFLAAHIVKQLLQQGHTVHGTVRSTKASPKIDALKALSEGMNGMLKLFEADLLKEGSFQEAFKGCEVIIHTASPFFLKVKDPQKDLVDPALQGTSNVMSTASETPSVKKVVLTSSIAAVVGEHKEIEKVGTFTQEHWNTTSRVDYDPYPYSKTVAERRAWWETRKPQAKWDLVVLNPGMLLGSSLLPSPTSGSIDLLRIMCSGAYKTGVPELYFACCSVEEVAKAHVVAAIEDVPSARYLLCEKVLSLLEIAQIIEKAYPGHYHLPKRNLPKWFAWIFAPFMGLSRNFIKNNVPYKLVFDVQSSKDNLKLDFNTVEQAIVEQVSPI